MKTLNSFLAVGPRAVTFGLVLTACTSDGWSQLVRSGSGGTAASIVPVVDAFRSDLGALNPNVTGSFASGRREINWDGVPDARSAPNNLPANFFNVNSPRGVLFSTPGTGFQVSANAGVPPIEFGNINASYSGFFQPFTAQRLFTALDANIMDVSFFVPGSETDVALTKGFGAVFSDVDLANTTSLQFFDIGNNSLGTFFAPNFSGDETFSFLGVSFNDAIISRVRITSGNGILSGSQSQDDLVDLVVMDDFIYGEPQRAPDGGSTLALLASTVAMLVFARRHGACKSGI